MARAPEAIAATNLSAPHRKRSTVKREFNTIVCGNLLTDKYRNVSSNR
jgi:hypothetical protein